MSTLTVSIDDQTLETLNELAKNSGEPVNVILERAIESYRRQRFLDGLSADFAKLRSDPKAWKDELDERAAWDATLSDGLED